MGLETIIAVTILFLVFSIFAGVDLTITPANVIKVSGSTREVTAGATITAGMPVYKDTTDSNKHKPIDVDAGAMQATIEGIALHGASNGQPLVIQYDGEITIGATVVVGETYLGSDNAGGIRPVADKNSGDRVSYVGYGKTTSTIQLDINNTGIVAP